MGPSVLLAHGGPVGAAFEMGFILVPIVIFVVLSKISKRRRDAEDEEVAATNGDAAEDTGADEPAP